MAHTQHLTMRRVLRREIAGTIGLLTDEQDFRAMRRYRTFAFDDHTTYLQQVEALLRTLAAQGSHTTVALFDPEEYAEYCAESGLEPDAPTSRTRFTAQLAATGPTVPYDGQSLDQLVPDLVDEAVRRATWEYATTLLARIGTCSTCGEDIGRTSFVRAAHLLTRVVGTASPGDLHLVCSVSAAPDTLVAVLRAEERTEGATRLDEAEALEFTTVLALGIATGSAGGLVMRTTAPDTTDRVYGWRLRGDTLEPLTAAEVFDAYCTDIESGDLVSPESGVDYCVPPDLGDEVKGTGHTH
ncbi:MULTISPECIES: hypothetical protein [unclassified Streptomyces]|uniref:hypothetical protein n=1 Tax=unclassified Streptomyces TaxID=2593676 RepID=UPI0022590996|nr:MULTISPECIES: hypothetical protein [unclassified Streptomyces]MCX4992395.1 hypothetical protein [Streptomyces sp. NBC_00568]MCX5002369.1 hypothetical protein [Streptomyces sp. NBC_00638]